MSTRRKIVKTKDCPKGLLYFPGFLSAAEYGSFLNEVEQLGFCDFVFQGFLAKRKVKHFGYKYEFYTPYVSAVDVFPDWLIELRLRAAQVCGISEQSIEQALVAQYGAGSGIGWHRDAPAFGPTVMGVSFGAPGTMRFRKEIDGGFEIYKQDVAPGSLYVMSGEARLVWQHSLSPVKDLRYSVTLRTVKENFKSENRSEISNKSQIEA